MFFEPTIAFMLVFYLAGIGDTGPDVEHQFKRQSGFGADLVMFARDFYLVWRPCVPAFALVDLRHADSWIVCRVLLIDCPFERCPEVLHQFVRSPRLRAPHVTAALNIVLPGMPRRVVRRLSRKSEQGHFACRPG